ncbi:hypothetical protein AD006_02810 [Pseudonocardia sp. EC080610-09]|uniref:DUF559 domain-containing protein n=1 Tax=unclassified Pseudonocardia TaxID=2619320 RepID=UPI00070695FA|nr:MULTISPECIES: DUF559 domain-containing protein [unclassified Pseudonocardia]ALL74523.1 hypothetical protein AD006_02810 [Pseudonocardia sp. EC080610-09]ALL81542.1 hypothetical protein AD017_10625 [Pseudonocardia sp. EC080619-01]
MSVPGWPEVFRGTAAVAAGLVTPGRLRGPSFERLLPDTYAPATGESPDLRLRSLAASLWAGDGAVLCGYSAAELQGRSCAPLGEPAEVVVPATCSGPRSRREVRVRRDALHPREIIEIAGVRVTTPMRTAFDLARRLPPVEGIVAIDALARGTFAPDLLLTYAARYVGLRGVRAVIDALTWADARSGSPPETRLRLILVRSDLPRPVPQHPVVDERRRVLWLDLAYPEHRLGVEYDGGDHFATPQAARADAQRHTRLAAAGWRVLRYTAAEMRREPQRIVTEVRRALGNSRRDAAQRRPVIDDPR